MIGTQSDEESIENLFDNINDLLNYVDEDATTSTTTTTTKKPIIINKGTFGH